MLLIDIDDCEWFYDNHDFMGQSIHLFLKIVPISDYLKKEPMIATNLMNYCNVLANVRVGANLQLSV